MSRKSRASAAVERRHLVANGVVRCRTGPTLSVTGGWARQSAANSIFCGSASGSSGLDTSSRAKVSAPGVNVDPESVVGQSLNDEIRNSGNLPGAASR